MTTIAKAPEGLPRPVLSALHPDVNNRSIVDLLIYVFAGRDPEVLATAPGRRQFNNMVRLMDKSVTEYTLARNHCEAWTQGLDVTGAQISYYFRAIDHMENCIGALHRTLLHLDRIRKLPAAPPVDRTAHRALRAGVAEINDLRDAIEHADERLSMAKGGTALPVVYLEAEHLSVGDDSIAYVDLAQWIHQTFRLVRMLLDEAPTGTAA